MDSTRPLALDSTFADVYIDSVAKSWAEDGGESGYTDAMELLDLGLHLIGDESEEVKYISVYR